MAKIVILDTLSQDGLDLLKNAGIEYEVRTGLAGEELKKTLTEFDGAICRSGVKITADVLEGNTRLRAIARAGVGTDNIDKAMATRLGIIVMNTPSGNTLSTAEQTLALMFALVRHTAPAYQSLIEGRWDKKLFTGTQLAGKTLGIIGLGRIGQAIAKRALAMEMKVIGFDPFMTEAKAKELGITLYANYKDMLPYCDLLTVHTPLTDATRGMISDAEIAMLPKGARLINCARGGIYDEAALVRGLESGQLGGVALDVYPSEPCKQNPLFGMKNVVCTPHLGASTEEAQLSVAVEAAQLMVDFFKTGAIRSAVNTSPLDPKTLEELRGYLNVAWRMGLFLGQMGTSAPVCLKLTYKGEVAKKNTALLTSAFAAGYMEKASDVGANIVNADILLRERGIELIEERSTEVVNFNSTITAQLKTETAVYTIQGTLFGNDMPRLIQIDDSRMESYLDGNLIIFDYDNVPGMLGKLGTLCGKHNANIAQMCVGASRATGTQIGTLSLDVVPTAELLEEIRNMEGVKYAKPVALPKVHELPVWLS